MFSMNLVASILFVVCCSSISAAIHFAKRYTKLKDAAFGYETEVVARINWLNYQNAGLEAKALELESRIQAQLGEERVLAILRGENEALKQEVSAAKRNLSKAQAQVTYLEGEVERVRSLIPMEAEGEEATRVSSSRRHEVVSLMWTKH